MTFALKQGWSLPKKWPSVVMDLLRRKSDRLPNLNVSVPSTSGNSTRPRAGRGALIRGDKEWLL